MRVKRIHLLLGLMGGLCLVTFLPPATAAPSTEPLPPLPLGNQGVPSDAQAPPVGVPQNLDFPGDRYFSNPGSNPGFSNANPIPDSKFYLVYIPGQNQQTLDRVRLYEPEAFFTQYKGRTVIQAGVFANRNNAERLARELEFAGVISAIATLNQPSSNVARTNVAPAFTTPTVAGNLLPVSNSLANPPIGTSVTTFYPPPPIPGGVKPNGYFVAIPGNPQELPRMIQEAIDAGIAPGEIFTREEPFGPHLAIGPFPDRTTAEQESGYLQKFGLDARIYFGD